jgi:hypothetical protein
LPLEGRHWELLDGAVIQMEMHCTRTSVFIGGLLFLIHQHTDGYVSPGGAWLIGFVVPENKTVMLFHPDIAADNAQAGRYVGRRGCASRLQRAGR